jgi:hypothetical protein
MSNPWRIALVVVLVLIGVGGGMCALRTAEMIEREVKGQEGEAEGAEAETDRDGSRSGR